MLGFINIYFIASQNSTWVSEEFQEEANFLHCENKFASSWRENIQKETQTSEIPVNLTLVTLIKMTEKKNYSDCLAREQKTILTA